ncbi:protein of unknown function [Paraburkholderia dioscoreae]|uniref:Uncharacterized protein n=1 Tax=Paraburkholderia dioscoreae TaxID=2604047 RepID=A0A5Q4YYP5_9BURK|nr:hypothetical protein [Paraburkholderia sp. USG1]VVD34384.1 protein of unknown function [Paraburkholderia dioscoreae]
MDIGVSSYGLEGSIAGGLIADGGWDREQPGAGRLLRGSRDGDLSALVAAALKMLRARLNDVGLQHIRLQFLESSRRARTDIFPRNYGARVTEKN